MDRNPYPLPWLQSLLVASLGAGVVTSLAIAQGQHPLQALLITLAAAGFALLMSALPGYLI